MKKKLFNKQNLKHQILALIFVACLAFAISCGGNKPENIVTLQGNIENLDPAIIIATYTVGDSVAIATIDCDKNGKFKYTSKIDSTVVFSIYMNNEKTSTMFFANRGDKITIKGDANYPNLMTINGNQINDEITAFKEQNKELLTLLSHLEFNMEYNKSTDDAEQASTSIIGDEEQAQINSYNHQLAQKAEDFVKQNPSKISSLVLINNFLSNPENPQQISRALSYMDRDVMKSQQGLNLKAFSDKINRSAEGATMPYFKLKDVKGKEITSTDCDGKYTLLSFVDANAKTQIIDEINIIKEDYSALNKDSVKFITIFIDSETFPFSKTVGDSIPWTVVCEKQSWASKIVTDYNIQTIPFNILISPNGEIKSRGITAAEIEKKIKKDLPKKVGRRYKK